MKRVLAILMLTSTVFVMTACGGVSSTGTADSAAVTEGSAETPENVDASTKSVDADAKEIASSETEKTADGATAQADDKKDDDKALTSSTDSKDTAAKDSDAANVEDKTVASDSKTDGAADKTATGTEDKKDATSEDAKDAAEDEKEVDLSEVNMFDETQTMYVKSAVNVRKGPTTEYDIVGSAKAGDELKVLGQYGKAGWYYIEYKKDKAFVSNKFLLKTKEEYDAYQVQLAAKTQQAQEAAAQAAAQQAAAQQQAQQAAAQQQAQQAAVQQQAQQAAAQQQTQQPAAQPAPAPAIAGTLFIGDSRCVQMKALVGQSSWICENSKGYEWLVSTALERADRIIGKGTRVVICLGVNDTENVEKYATTINQKAAEWAAKGAKTYYVSVNPVSENPYRTEDEVVYFNSRMPGLLSGVTWIDTHTSLVNNGYQLVDGLHYNDSTNINIYNMIISQLK